MIELSNYTQLFSQFSVFVSLFGLSLDCAGAIFVLATDHNGVASRLTIAEKHHLRRFFGRMKKGETIDENEPHFAYLKDFSKMVLRQKRDVDFPVRKIWIEGDTVHFQTHENNKNQEQTVTRFERLIKEYDGIDREFISIGAGLLLVGFFYQITVEVFRVTEPFGFILFLIGSIVVAAVTAKMLYRHMVW